VCVCVCVCVCVVYGFVVCVFVCISVVCVWCVCVLFVCVCVRATLPQNAKKSAEFASVYSSCAVHDLCDTDF